MTQNRIEKLRRKLIASRSRLIIEKPLFGIMIMHMRFVASEKIYKMSTNGKTVFFSPDFIEKLYEQELDFLLCHQLMHIILKDIWRPSDYEGINFHYACNIVANAHMLKDRAFKHSYPHLNEIHTRTLFPEYAGDTLTPYEAINYIPFDLMLLPERTRGIYMFDSDQAWGKDNDFISDGVLVLGSNTSPPESTREGDGEDTEPIMSDTDTVTSSEIKKYCDEMIFAATECLDGASDPNLHALLTRAVEAREKSEIDWKKELQRFLRMQIQDYSFTPPDRRFTDQDIFLPDFNIPSHQELDLLFVCDTSASIDQNMLSAVYGEIRAALEAYSGNICGKLVFFDTEIIGPYKISDVATLKDIIPRGGGGTSFFPIFRFIEEEYGRKNPDCVIIFTDGFAEFPTKNAAQGMSVLWIINNDAVVPPFGKLITIKS